MDIQPENRSKSGAWKDNPHTLNSTQPAAPATSSGARTQENAAAIARAAQGTAGYE